MISCGKDGGLILHSEKHAYRPVHSISPIACGWSVHDHFLHTAISVNEMKSQVSFTTTTEDEASSLSSLFHFSSTPSTASMLNRSSGQRIKEYNASSMASTIHSDQIGMNIGLIECLATEYQFHSQVDTIVTCCLHNSQIAFKYNRIVVGHGWRLLAQLAESHMYQNLNKRRSVQTVGLEPMDETQEFHKTKEHVSRSKDGPNDSLIESSDPLEKSKLDLSTLTDVSLLQHVLGLDECFILPQDLQDDDEVDLVMADDIEMGMDSKASGLQRRSLTTKKDSLISIEPLTMFHSLAHLDTKALICKILMYYVESGDVQTTCCMYLVVHKLISIPNEQTIKWYSGYLEILYQLQLWTIATEFLNDCHDSKIREVNKQSTTVNVNCGSCGKSSLTLKSYCDYCKSLFNTCCLCHQPVKGAYVWCHGCGHGGHAGHLEQWFKGHVECPTGCGHACTKR